MIQSIFSGLYGYECVMLICGFVLFLFALAAITVMIVQQRSFKAAMSLIVLAIVLMGYPGIQAVKFNDGVVEIDKLGAQPTAQVDPQQKAQYAQTLASVQSRASNNPTLLAKVANGYRAIGNVDQAYELAQSVLAKQPPSTARKLLLPVLTAKLEQITPPIRDAAAPISPSQQQQIAVVASQVQAQKQVTPLPATVHVALARANVALGDTQQARANVEAARHIDPQIKISPALKNAVQLPPAAPTHGGH